MKRQRKAVKVEPAAKAANLRRLRRIEGQVRGLHKMVEEERYCADILMQITSVQQALQGVSRELMRNHLQNCAAHAARNESQVKATKVYDEIIDLMYRHVL